MLEIRGTYGPAKIFTGSLKASTEGYIIALRN